MPRESLGAPEDLLKEAPCQLTFGKLTFGKLEGERGGASFGTLGTSSGQLAESRLTPTLIGRGTGAH